MSQAEDPEYYRKLFGPDGERRVMDLHLIDHKQLVRLASAALAGHTVAGRLCSCVHYLIESTLQERRLCLCCGAPIDLTKEVVFCIIARPDAQEVAGGSVLCPECGERREDRARNAVQGLRSMPMLTSVEVVDLHAAGHA
jgi:hypothetical protein